ncbi:MAG: hypothetical protein ABJA02_01765 [Acidobacteriota bacterium]
MKKHLSRITLGAIIAALSISFVYASSTVDYRFKVHNKSGLKIVKLLASPDGKKYRNFDIGSGIKAGSTMELVWDQSTDSGNCEWHLKAVFSDGSESEPAVFDFCEEDLVVEFT